MPRPFRQVDVFSAVPGRGNALAVIHDAAGLTDEDMAVVARWTNLSETVFLSAPTDPRADYRVRIWTTGGELPFAGHPTLGSAHAWLEAGGVPQNPEFVVQECGVGLVQVRCGERLAFAAPDLLRSGPVEPEVLTRVIGALRIRRDQVRASSWVDNGPGWVGIELASAAEVLAIDPDVPAMSGLKVTVVGQHDESSRETLGADVEVRAFYCDDRDYSEDPVTGSANAGLAQWLIGAGRLPETYVARQGTVLDRDGRIYVAADGDQVWVGGEVRTLVVGEISL